MELVGKVLLGPCGCPGVGDRGVASADLGLRDARPWRPTPPMPRRVPIGMGRRCSTRPRRSPASARSATRPTRPPEPPRRSFTSDARTPPAAPPRCRALFVDGQGGPLPRSAGLDSEAIDLAAREHQLVEFARQDLSNAEIAARLVPSVRTVESHLYRAMQKLGVSDRREL